jgi:hypothetical protein
LFCLQEPASPAAGEKNILNSSTIDFIPGGSAFDFVKFICKNDLVASRFNKDDCLVIKCSNEIITSDSFDVLGEVVAIVILSSYPPNGPPYLAIGC